MRLFAWIHRSLDSADDGNSDKVSLPVEPSSSSSSSLDGGDATRRLRADEEGVLYQHTFTGIFFCIFPLFAIEIAV